MGSISQHLQGIRVVFYERRLAAAAAEVGGLSAARDQRTEIKFIE
jgi:hypothetical protein